jgi:hypothetical protein
MNRGASCLLAAVLSTASAAADTEVIQCRVSATADSQSPDSPASRVAAAQLALPEVLRGRLESLKLLACALGGPLSGLTVAGTPSDGEWIVTIDDPRGLESLISTLDRAYLTYGLPTVLVEPERPTSPQDRYACAAALSELRRLGLRAVDGEQARISRRDAADGAVSRGLDGSRARAVLDGLEGDFNLRIGLRMNTGEVAAYGIPLRFADAVVSQSLTRVGANDAVQVPSSAASARSRSEQSAERTALKWAIRDGVAAAAAAVSYEWIQTLEGHRPWGLELMHSSALCIETLKEQNPSLRLREHHPGVRSIMEGSATSVQSAAASFGALRVEQARPGYIRATCSQPSHAERGIWVIAAALAVSVIAAWRAMRRPQAWAR